MKSGRGRTKRGRVVLKLVWVVLKSGRGRIKVVGVV